MRSELTNSHHCATHTPSEAASSTTTTTTTTSDTAASGTSLLMLPLLILDGCYVTWSTCGSSNCRNKALYLCTSAMSHHPLPLQPPVEQVHRARD